MKSLIAIFFVTSLQLFGDIAVVGLREKDFSAERMTGWAYANSCLQKKGERFFCTELQDKDLRRLQDSSTTVIVFNNLPHTARKDWRAFLAKIPAKKILLCWASSIAMPEMYKKKNLKLFDVVLTTNSSLVDGKKFFQFYQPTSFSVQKGAPSFEERRLLTQIARKGFSSNRKELYSLRKKAIRYFERHQADFCFYGPLWNKKAFHTYGGTVADTLSCLQKYRFCLCFENAKLLPGNVSSRIFDCFRAKCVPVYFGASDIDTLIPKGCYIKWEKFKSFKKLYVFLEKMSKTEYELYVKNAQKFLVSSQAKKFSQNNFGRILLKAIAQAKISKKKHFVIKK